VLDPEIDHLVPVSAGGSHTWDNVALAHRRCNYERREVGPAQLRLLG
jgi:5-methylcytosine-specific restriction endonuclease McrA